jgi:hypothetical protein
VKNDTPISHAFDLYGRWIGIGTRKAIEKRGLHSDGIVYWCPHQWLVAVVVNYRYSNWKGFGNDRPVPHVSTSYAQHRVSATWLWQRRRVALVVAGAVVRHSDSFSRSLHGAWNLAGMALLGWQCDSS